MRLHVALPAAAVYVLLSGAPITQYVLIDQPPATCTKQHTINSFNPESSKYYIFTHLNLCLATATQNLEVGENYIHTYNLNQNICQFNANFYIKFSCLKIKLKIVENCYRRD